MAVEVASLPGVWLVCEGGVLHLEGEEEKNMADKKKPVKLEWQGGLAEGGAEPVVVRGKDKEKARAQPAAPVQLPKGTVRVRKEAKGRAGHPVLVLSGFQPKVSGESALRALLAAIQPRLGCGGAVEGETILVQTQNLQRLETVLRGLGLEPKPG